MIRIYRHKTFALVACVLVLTSSLLTISCSKGYKEYFDVDNKGGYIYQRLQANPEFSSFAKALEKANIVQFLSQGGLYTVFAPTNEAFSKFLSCNGYSSIEAV